MLWLCSSQTRTVACGNTFEQCFHNSIQTIKSWCRSSVKWKQITLDNLFGGTKHKPSCPSRTIEEEKEEAMEQAMVEALEDEWLDDGAIEINSDEEYQ